MGGIQNIVWYYKTSIRVLGSEIHLRLDSLLKAGLTRSQGDTMLDAARVLGSTELCHVQALKDRALRSAAVSHVISWFDSWDWIFFLQVYNSASVHVQGNKFHFIYRSPIDVVGDILSRLVWSDLHFSFNRENVPEYGRFFFHTFQGDMWVEKERIWRERCAQKDTVFLFICIPFSCLNPNFNFYFFYFKSGFCWWWEMGMGNWCMGNWFWRFTLFLDVISWRPILFRLLSEILSRSICGKKIGRMWSCFQQ